MGQMNSRMGQPTSESDEHDRAAIRACLLGDHSAFESLVIRYERALFNVALRMLRNREDARDATQNAFIKAYQNLASFDITRRFFSWIYRILSNECLNVIRRRRPQEAVPELPVELPTFDALDLEERRHAVSDAIAALSPDSREVIILRHYAERSYEEIAEALGIQVSTVKSRLYTARQRLGERLFAWGPPS